MNENEKKKNLMKNEHLELMGAESNRILCGMSEMNLFVLIERH